MWGKTQVSFGTFGIYEQTNITVFAMTVAGSSAIPWRPPEAALYLGVIELCTSRLLFQSHDTLPPIILVAEPLRTNVHGQWTIVHTILSLVYAIDTKHTFLSQN